MKTQTTMAHVAPFDGHTYDRNADHFRLATSLERVRQVMLDGQWRTLRTIADAVGASEAGVSARLRDLRKGKYGAHRVESRRAAADDGGLWVYRVDVSNG